MEIIEWKINHNLKEELSNHYQAKQSYEMKERSPREIIDMYTFSYGSPNLPLSVALSFLDFVEKIIGKPIKGIGLEVGAGPGTHSALLAKKKHFLKYAFIG